MKRWKKIVIVAAIIAAVGAVYARSEPDELMTYRYTVQPGDTVWSVCSKVASDKDDLNVVVWRAVRDSHLGSGMNLQPGDEVVVRVKAVAK